MANCACQAEPRRMTRAESSRAPLLCLYGDEDKVDADDL